MRRKNSTAPERGVENQTITVGGLGTAGGDYKTRVRATTHEGIHSPWTEDVEFTLTDADEGTASDPNLPDTVSNLEIRGMLNAIYVKFDDEFFATDNPLMSYNMGSYEIEVSNVSDAFPATGNVWTTKLGDDPDAGPPDGPTRKFNVPTGAGFICTGMKSTGSGGLEHFVRVRGINSHGSTSSAYSTVRSVTLDTDDVSQTAVVIGQDAIYATHVKAGTLTAEELQAGTITATEISSGQIFASQIRLPAANPGTGGEAGEFHATRKFTIDQDGNMWWGNYADIDDAQAGIVVSGTDASTSWIDDTGNAQFIGSVSTGAGSATNIFASGNLGEARIVLGDNTTAIGDGGYGSAASGGYGYIVGFTAASTEIIPGHVVFTDESGVAAAYLVAPRFHNGFNFSGVRLRDNNMADGSEAILVASTGSWAGVVKGPDVGNYGASAVDHDDSSFVISTADGAYIYNSANAPSSTTNRLYSLSDGAGGADLYWGDDEIGAGGDSSLTFLPTSQSGTNLASVSVSGDDVEIFAVKTITTTSDTGRKGLAITTGSSASTGVQLLLSGLDVSTLVSGDYIPFTRMSGNPSANQNYKVTVSNLANCSAFTGKFLLLSGGTMVGGSTITGSSSSGLVVRGNTGQSGNLRADNDNSKGVEVQSGGSVKIYYGASLAFQTSSSVVTSVKNHRIQDGTAAVPGLHFMNDGDTGIYRDSANANMLKFATAATHRLSIDAGGVTGPDSGGLVVQGTTGQSGNLRANAGASKGIEVQSGGSVKIYHGTSTAIQTNTSVNSTFKPWRIPDGTAAVPGLHFVNDGDTGIFRRTTNELNFSTAGVERLMIDASGNVGINETSPSYPLDVNGISRTDYLYLANNGTAGGPALRFSNDIDCGLYLQTYWMHMTGNGSSKLGVSRSQTTGIWMAPTTTATFSSYLTISSGGELFKWSSRGVLKENVETVAASKALTRIKALRPVEFNFKQEAVEHGTNEMVPFSLNRGFIAEEVAAVDHTMASWGWVDPDNEYNELLMEEIPEDLSLDDAVPTNVNIFSIVADLVAAVQSFDARIAALEG